MKTFASEWQKNLDDSLLRLPKCDHCGRWNWYPVPVCNGCGHSEFSWCDIVMAGTLFSWTRVHRNFSGMELGAIPYTVGLVNLQGAPGARVPARFMGENPQTLKLDQPVVLYFQEVNNRQVLCFRC